MEIEVLLSAVNLDENELDNMNINNKCIVINQCNKDYFSKHNNFDVYSCTDKGLSNSRNRGLGKVKGDIILLSNDVKYNDYYEKIVLDQFNKNKDADIILFNVYNSNEKEIKKSIKLHRKNIGEYSSQSIAIRRKSILKNKILFNPLFGEDSVYTTGDVDLFIANALQNKLNVYSCSKYIGTLNNTTYLEHNREYFFDRGALFTAISVIFRKILMIRYLFKNKDVLDQMKFREAYKYMKKGSKDYLKRTYRK